MVTIGVLVLLFILVLFVGGSYAWHANPYAWEEHTFYGINSPEHPEGQAVVFHSGLKLPQYLRFKDSEFTLTNVDGTEHKYDVTSILNGMARGLRGTKIAATPLGLNMKLDYTGKEEGEEADVVFEPLDAVTFNIDFQDKPPISDDFQNNEDGFNGAIRRWRSTMNSKYVAKLTTKVRTI